MNIYRNFKQIRPLLACLAVLSPALVYAAPLSAAEEKIMEQQQQQVASLEKKIMEQQQQQIASLLNRGIVSAHQIAAIPQTQFVRSPFANALATQGMRANPNVTQIDGDTFVQLASNTPPNPENIAAMSAKLEATLTSLPRRNNSFVRMKAPGSWADVPQKSNVVAEKSIALSDPAATVITDNPLNAKKQLTSQAANLVNSIKLGEGDTAVIVGGEAAATAVGAELMKNGTPANQVKILSTPSSFAPSPLELELGGAQDSMVEGAEEQAQDGTSTTTPVDDNVAAIQIMHRATFSDLGAGTVANPSKSLEDN